MNAVKKINWMYLITVAVLMIGSFFPIHRITNNKIVVLLYSQLIIVLPSLVYWYTTKQNYKELVGFRKIKLKTVALIIVFTFVMIPVMGFINTLSRFFTVDATTGTMTQISEGSSFFVALLTIAVVPAILEESVYRGIFFQEYRRANPRAAIFLSALLFAMLHGNFNQFSYALFMGIIFSMVIEATDSIASTMLMHFIINGNSVLMLYLLPKISQMLPGGAKSAEELFSQAENMTALSPLQTISLYGSQTVVCCVIGYLLFCAIAKSCHRTEHIKQLFGKQPSSEPKKRLFTIPLVAALAFLLCNMIALEIVTRV